jgi:hypothetical protein
MKSNTTLQRRTIDSAGATIDRRKLEAESAVAIQFAILKKRHRERADIRDKLAEIAARREKWGLS